MRERPRIFESKVVLDIDHKFECELVIERTVILGSRISLVGEIKRDAMGKHPSILIKSEFIRPAREQEQR